MKPSLGLNPSEDQTARASYPTRPCSVTFYDEHRPLVQTYKVIWRDLDDPRGFEAGRDIAPMLQKWICEAMDHIYNGGPRPTLEPYIMALGPREITSPNSEMHPILH